MNDPAPSHQYPAWVLRFNRAVTSRTCTYLAAALFVVDGVPRLFDGRVIRGVGNLAIAAVLVAMRERTRRVALGEDKPSERRAQWAADHLVVGGLLGGTAWGAAMSFFLIATQEGSILFALLLGLGSGLLLFGPGVVLLSRRYRTSDDERRRR